MRRQDKYRNMEQANLMLESSYLKRKGFINEFWPFTKSKKQTKQEPKEEVYKSTTPPRSILIDLEKSIILLLLYYSKSRIS